MRRCAGTPTPGAELAERQALDGMLMDGLDPDELWTEDGDALHAGAEKDRPAG